jgi:outer membrane lipoprotein LolB
MMKKTIFLLLLLSLTACAPPPRPSDPQGLRLRETIQPRLESLRAWQLNGGIAANSADDGWDARVNWRQREDGYELRFSAPLGQGALFLQGDAGGVVLRTAEGETRSAPDPESLLAQTAGVSVPVSALYYWIRGLPVPDAAVDGLVVNAQGYLEALEQLGWSVEYARYRAYGELRLPDKLILKNPEWIVKLIVSEWNIQF